MPKPAQPPPVPKAPPTLVQSAGKQEDFAASAAALAEKRGWFGEDHFVANEIRVDDARNYITKVMHEHFQAAAKGLPQPDYKAACEHLAVDNDDEQAAIDEALKVAFEAGKGAQVSSHPVTVGGLAANITVGASAALGKFAEASAGKGG